MNHLQKHFSASRIALAVLLAAAPMGAWAAPAPALNSASGYAVLSAGSLTPTTPLTAPAVTTTGSTTVITINGNVGSAGPVTLTNSAIIGNEYNILGGLTLTPPSTISGTQNLPLPSSVLTDFNTAYNSYPAIGCTGSLATSYTDTTLMLAPGVYCNTGAVTFTRTTLTLNGQGNANAVWIFKVGTSKDAIVPGSGGALTGTDFSVVFLNNVGQPCNVTWWVADAATVTRGSFLGTILAGAADPATGAAITMTGVAGAPSSFNGNALAGAAVTVTDVTVNSCGTSGGGTTGGGNGNHGDGHDGDRDGHDRHHDGQDKDKDHKDDSRHSFKDGGNPFGHGDKK